MGSEPHTTRDAALRALIDQVEHTRRDSDPTGIGRPHSAARTAAITAVVLVAVVVASVFAVQLHGRSPFGQGSAAGEGVAASPSTTVTPKPGQVLAAVSSKHGRDQTRLISPNGMTFVVKYHCSGGGTLTISIPHNFTSSTSCDGKQKGGDGASNKGTAGTVPFHVKASTAATRWALTVTAATPSYVTPTPIPDPTASDGSPAPYCDDSILTAFYRAVRGPGEVTEATGGEIAFTNTSTTACTLYGSPTLQFLSPTGALLGRHSNARTDQRGLAFKTISPVVLTPGGHAYVELDYYNRLFFTQNPDRGPCTLTNATGIRVDLADALAGPAQHGVLTVSTPTIAACQQPVLQLFGTDYVDYRMHAG